MGMKSKKAPKARIIHKTLVRPPLPVKKVMNFKVTAEEKKAIEAVAEKYCKGNVTALVKLAVKQFKPSKSDLVQLR